MKTQVVTGPVDPEDEAELPLPEQLRPASASRNGEKFRDIQPPQAGDRTPPSTPSACLNLLLPTCFPHMLAAQKGIRTARYHCFNLINWSLILREAEKH